MFVINIDMLVEETTIALSGAETPCMNLLDVVEQFGENERSFEDILSREGTSLVSANIASTRSTHARDFILIQCEDGSSLVVTPEHKIYVTNKKSWERAEIINSTCSLMTSKNSSVKLTSTHNISDQVSSKVHALTVVPTQCYFANNILVRND